MSGVTVQDDVVNQFNNLKLKHMYRFIRLKVTDNEREIEVEKTVESSTYAEFLEQLPISDCRYFVYAYQLDMGDGSQKDQLLFIIWSPEVSRIKTKMLYSASVATLQRKLVGIDRVLQATDKSELAEEAIISKIKSLMGM